jgi:hypothetical protein
MVFVTGTSRKLFNMAILHPASQTDATDCRWCAQSRLRDLGIWLVVVALAPGTAAAAPEYIASEQPAPASVEDEISPMDEVVPIEVPLPSRFPRLKKRLETAAPFWRDTQLLLHPRVYYFDRERDNADDSVALAYGGWLAYDSGWWRDRFKLNASVYTTQRAYGPDDKGGTLLLKEVQQGFTVLGKANVELKFSEELSATLYRQSFNLPYLNKNDSRMVPNTFEAYTLVKRPLNHWAFVVSQVRQMKRRERDDFVSMSEAAGFEDRDEPLSMAGVRYEFSDDINIGAISQYAWEFMNTFYSEANAVWSFADDWALRLGGQYTDQRSVGDEIGGDFDTFVYGGRVAASYRSATLTLAFSSTDDGAGIRNPFGGYPGYLNLMIAAFNRADEDAWLVGASYDFARIGVPGMSSFVNYARGNTPDRGANASPDQWEFDITVDYRLQSEWLNGLWLRARAAFLDQDDDVLDVGDVRDYRVILNYDLPIL